MSKESMLETLDVIDSIIAEGESEYEYIECIDNLTGTVEIMRRKIEKSE